MAQSTLSAQEQRMVALVHDIYVTAEGIEISLFRIFHGLSYGPYHQSKAIFYSQLNPRGRRDMISALAIVSMRYDPDELKTLSKLIERARKAANKRNIVAHGEWQTYADGTVEEYRRSTVSPDMMDEVELSEAQLKSMLTFMKEVSDELFKYILYNRAKWWTRQNAWRKLAS